MTVLCSCYCLFFSSLKLYMHTYIYIYIYTNFCYTPFTLIDCCFHSFSLSLIFFLSFDLRFILSQHTKEEDGARILQRKKRGGEKIGRS